LRRWRPRPRLTPAQRAISEDYSVEGGPDGGFTQRATIDHDLGEWHLLSGLMMDRRNQASTVRNSLWIRRIATNDWIHIPGSEDGPVDEPKPRYAHQVRRRTGRCGASPTSRCTDGLRSAHQDPLSVRRSI
jgi:hypothetical protein